MSEKEIAKREELGLATLPDGATLKMLIQENMDGHLDVGSLDRIKMPPAGITSWSVPTLDGEESVKAIEGIIIHKQPQNAYWSGDISTGAGVPPDCVSRDAITGIGTPGGDCATCPYNQFGSDGKGKACKNILILYLLQPNKILPSAIFLPPTSIPVVKKYLVKLTCAGIPFYSVISQLKLEKVKNADGIEYSKVVISTKQINPEGKTDAQRVMLPQETITKIKEYRASIIPALSAVEIVSTDYYVEAEKEEV